MILFCCGFGSAGTAAFSQAVAAPPGRRSTAAIACPSQDKIRDLLASASGLLEQNRFQDAAALIQAQAGPRCDPRLSLMLAAALEGGGDENGALHALQQAHSAWPANTSVGTSLARAWLQRKDIADAQQALARCVPSASTPLRELQMMAMVHLEAHDLLHAEQAAILAYRTYPSQETLLFVANVLQLQGRSQDVVKLLNERRSAYGDSAAFLITAAESENDATLYVEARRDAERAIALTPDSYPAHYVLGNVLVKTGDLTGGIREYETAIRISPQQPRTYYQMGRALEAAGKESDAVNAYQEALARDDNYAPAYCAIAKLELRSNQLQAAVEHLNRALQANPAFQDSYFLLVQAYARLGDKDKSRSILKDWNDYKRAHTMQAAGVDREDTLLQP